MTALTGRTPRPAVLVGENAPWHRRPLYPEIAHRAHAAGLPGAGVFRGIEGLGGSFPAHTARPLSPTGDLPAAIVIAGTEGCVRGFLPQLDEPVTQGLVTSDGCEAVRYPGRAAGPDGAPGTKDGTRR